MAANSGNDLRDSLLRTIVTNLIGGWLISIGSRLWVYLRKRAAEPKRPHNDTPYTDPVTGDKLTRGEWASWGVQRIIRRWWFLGIVTLVTITCWVWGSQAPGVLVWWNLAASYMALVIEGLTAMVLIQQCLRDAVVSRQTRAISQRTESIEDRLLTLAGSIEQRLERLVPDDAGSPQVYTAGIRGSRGSSTDSHPKAGVREGNESSPVASSNTDAGDAPREPTEADQSATGGARPSRAGSRSTKKRPHPGDSQSNATSA